MTLSVKIAIISFAVVAIAALLFAVNSGAQLLTFWPIESAADLQNDIANALACI